MCSGSFFEYPGKNIHTHTKNENEKRPLNIKMMDNQLKMDRDDFSHSVKTLLKDKKFGVFY
jgi:hypothetical protein